MFLNEQLRDAPLWLNLETKHFWPELKKEFGVSETGAAIILAAYNSVRNIAYSRNRNHYSIAQRYRFHLYTYEKVVRAVDELENLGLIENHKSKVGQRGRQSVLKPKEILFLIVDRLIREGLKIEPARGREVIILRDGNGDLLNYRDTGKTHKMRKNVQTINDALSSVTINGCAHSQLARIFNQRFERGGRFYATGDSWQNLPKLERRTLQIDGLPTKELDFRSLHPVMLYAMTESRLDGDAYDICGFPRPLVKVALLIMINAKNQTSALRALVQEPAIGEMAKPQSDRAYAIGRKLFAEIEKRHQRISHHFYSDAGSKLMKKDSDIAESVMLQVAKNGGVALPIHDSFIVQESKVDFLRDAMDRAAYDLAKVTCEIAEV